MLNEKSDLPRKSNYYHITVEGCIDASWSEWLGGLQLDSLKEENGLIITILSGELKDQAALRGLMNRIWDLNLVVLSLQQVKDPDLSRENL